LKKIENINFDVIFTTAYDQYAIEAFKINASNYLLKPIDVEDLKNAIQKVIEQKQAEETAMINMLKNIQSNSDFKDFRISIPFNKGIEFLKAKDIIYCKSDNNYTYIFLSDGTSRFISKTLKIIENKLPKPMFYRPHNSFVVNLDYVTKFYKSDGGYLEMSNGDKIRIARNKKEDIINLL
jgi:two-component system LytT family response regulator